jgi:hypothetical protein
MKKIGFGLASLCLSIVFLTSCMKGSNVTEFIVLGVIDFNKTLTPVIKTSDGDFYSPTISTLIEKGEMSLGDCYMMYIRLDRDLPENSSNAITTYGYQTVTILQQLKLQKFELRYSLTDTTHVITDEIPIVKAYNEGNIAFAEGYLFLGHVVNIPEGWELYWNMSIDPGTMMPTIEDNKRYYDLYLRAAATKKSDQTIKAERSAINAYYIGSFLTNAANIEKNFLGSEYNASGSTFSIRFNFPSNVDESTQTITWSSNKFDLYVAAFLTINLY